MNLDHEFKTMLLPEMKIPTRLKPLKFHDYKTRGTTEKKLKGPTDMPFDNQSTAGFTDR